MSLNKEVGDLKSKGLDSRWYSEDGQDQDAKDKTTQVLLNSTIQFRLLKKILSDMFREKSLEPKDLDKPNLDQKVYYNEGFQRALQEVYRLLP